MLIPFLKKNGKYSVYRTEQNYTKEDFSSESVEKMIKANRILSVEFDFIDFYHEGFARALKNGKWYFINSKGESLRTKNYTEIRDFEGGIAPVKDTYYWSFINRNGIEVSKPADYFEYSRLHKKYISVFVSRYWPLGDIQSNEFDEGLLDLTGFEIVPPLANRRINPMSKFICISRDSYGISFVDFNGNPIFREESNKFDWIDGYYNNRSLATLKKEKGYVIINEKLQVIKKIYGILGEPIYDFENSASSYFFDGICLLQVCGKWGFIDTDGEFVIEPEYDYLEVFTGDYTIAGIQTSLGLKYGIVDKNFTEKTQFIYDKIEFLCNRLASVNIDDKIVTIDMDGKLVSETKHSYSNELNEELDLKKVVKDIGDVNFYFTSDEKNNFVHDSQGQEYREIE